MGPWFDFALVVIILVGLSYLLPYGMRKLRRWFLGEDD